MMLLPAAGAGVILLLLSSLQLFQNSGKSLLPDALGDNLFFRCSSSVFIDNTPRVATPKLVVGGILSFYF